MVKGQAPPPPLASSPSQSAADPVIDAQVGILSKPRVEDAETTPVEEVTRTPLGAEEIVRFVVEAKVA